jgi:hypothetical protein
MLLKSASSRCTPRLRCCPPVSSLITAACPHVPTAVPLIVFNSMVISYQLLFG